MKKYKVKLISHDIQYVTVTAKDENEAMLKAETDLDSDMCFEAENAVEVLE